MTARRAVFALALLTTAAPALGDVRGDQARLARAWRSDGAEVVRLRSRLLERGASAPLPLLPELMDARRPGCTTVVVLGPAGSSFVVSFGDEPEDDDDWPAASARGVVEVVRCGWARTRLRELRVELRSPRALLDVSAATSRDPLPPVTALLPERNPGPRRAREAQDPVPALPPLDVRAADARARAESAGALDSARDVLQLGAEGRGETLISLEAGCHELTVLSDTHTPSDLDLEVSWSTGEPAASDRGEGPDAHVLVCAGATRLAKLRISGGVPRAAVTLLRARWSLPRGLPEAFAPEVRAELARAVGLTWGRALVRRPVRSLLGVAGVTRVPLELWPDACYVIASAPWSGDASAVMALYVDSEPRATEARSAAEGGGASASFCARGQARVSVDVRAGGEGTSWVLSVWRVAGTPLGAVAE